MKTITIGRGDGADIIIDDEMISRRHAILKISSFGKMEIVNMGKNGTFVNGIKLRPNVPFPVTRKDIVNFADVSQLNWALVPDNTKYYKYIILAVAVLLAVLILILSLKSCETNDCNTVGVGYESTVSNDADSKQDGSVTAQRDSAKAVSLSPIESKGLEDTDSAKNERVKRSVKGKTVQQLFPKTKKKDALKKKKVTPEEGKEETDPLKKNKSNNKTVIM